jgi:hypothetical protein
MMMSRDKRLDLEEGLGTLAGGKGESAENTASTPAAGEAGEVDGLVEERAHLGREEQQEGGATHVCMICYRDLRYSEKLPRLAGPEEEGGGTAAAGTTTTTTTAAAAEGVCPHSYCRACVGRYLETCVGEGRLEFPCPLFGEDGCAYAFRYERETAWHVYIVDVPACRSSCACVRRRVIIK